MERSEMKNLNLSSSNMRFLAFARNDITVILTTTREEESLFNERVHRDSSHSTIGLGSERQMKPNCHTVVTETSTLCIYPVMRKSDFCCRKIMGIK